jgi:hypothetical protein|tara:strand:- start:4 stop:333 length:330 start_codon:yes stop_codon:yes gene_type:complete
MCGCKKGYGLSKRGGMSIGGAGMRLHGAGYKKKKRRRKKRKKASGIVGLFNPTASLASLIRKRKPGGGGRFLSGAVWHGYGKGSGMAIAGAGLYGKRLLGRNGGGRRQI